MHLAFFAFWISSVVITISFVLLIISLIAKNRTLKRITFALLLISIIIFVLSIRSCTEKVKSDFGYKEKTKDDSIRDSENLIKTKQVITQFDSIEHIFDSIKHQQLQNGK